MNCHGPRLVAGCLREAMESPRGKKEKIMGYKIEALITADGPIEGDLDLSGTGITALPEGIQVGGSLDLSGTGITALPEGIKESQVIR